MPKRKRTNRIDSPDVQGDDSWIELQLPTMREMSEKRTIIAHTQGQLDKLLANGSDDTEALAELQQQQEALTYTMFSEYIIDWNWVDDDDKSLPKPHNNPDIFAELTSAEIQFLSNAFSMSEAVKKR